MFDALIWTHEMFILYISSRHPNASWEGTWKLLKTISNNTSKRNLFLCFQILHKNSKPSQTWRLEVSWSNKKLGCKGWTAASSKTPPSEAAGSFSKQPNVTCNSEAAPPREVRLAPQRHRPKRPPTVPREGICQCPIVHRRCKWSEKGKHYLGCSFVQAWSCRTKPAGFFCIASQAVLALEVSRWPLLRRQTTSWDVRSLLCRLACQQKLGILEGKM